MISISLYPLWYTNVILGRNKKGIQMSSFIMAEVAGLEPAKDFSRRFSGPMPYQLGYTSMAGAVGIEPTLTSSKPVAFPLGYAPIILSEFIIIISLNSCSTKYLLPLVLIRLNIILWEFFTLANFSVSISVLSIEVLIVFAILNA